MSDVTSDHALLERIQAGDKSACAECIEMYGAGIYRLALHLTQHEADAEDVVQETFLSAFKSIDRFEGRSSLKTWLYRITYNAAMMHLRRQNPALVSMDAPDTHPDVPLAETLINWCCLPESDFETGEVRAELERAIRELPETLRAVFILRELEGLSTQECADVLQMSDANVKQRLHRARLWLRERLSVYFAEWV